MECDGCFFNRYVGDLCKGHHCTYPGQLEFDDDDKCTIRRPETDTEGAK